MRKRLAIAGLSQWCIAVGAAASAPAQTGAAAAARPAHLERRHAVRRRHALAGDGQPERRRLPRPRAVPLQARPRRDRRGARGRHRRGAPAGADGLEHAAAAGRRPAHDRRGGPPARRPTARTSFASSSPARNGGRRVYGYEPPRQQPSDERPRRPRAGDPGRLPRPAATRSAERRRWRSRPTRSACGCSSSRSRACPKPTVHDLRTGGIAVAPAVQLAWPTRGSATHYVQISATGVAQSGLYFLRVNSADGRVGYAPLILRPRTLGEHKVAVVLSTNTWQAYNFLDAQRRRLGRQLVRRRREPDRRPRRARSSTSAFPSASATGTSASSPGSAAPASRSTSSPTTTSSASRAATRCGGRTTWSSSPATRSTSAGTPTTSSPATATSAAT